MSQDGTYGFAMAMPSVSIATIASTSPRSQTSTYLETRPSRRATPSESLRRLLAVLRSR